METTQLEKKETPQGQVEQASSRQSYIPAVDIYEKNDRVVLLADMPGVDKDSVDITLEKNVLAIVGRTPPLVTKNPVVYREYGEGDYRRSFELSAEIDQDRIEAVVKNGVLKLTLYKIAPTKKKVEVK